MQAERVAACAVCARWWQTCAREARPGQVDVAHFEALAADPDRTLRGCYAAAASCAWPLAAGMLGGLLRAATSIRWLQRARSLLARSAGAGQVRAHPRMLLFRDITFLCKQAAVQELFLRLRCAQRVRARRWMAGAVIGLRSQRRPQPRFVRKRTTRCAS